MNATSTTEYTGHGNSGGGVAGAILLYLFIFFSCYYYKEWKDRKKKKTIIFLSRYEYELHNDYRLTPKKSLNPLRRNNVEALTTLMHAARNNQQVEWNNKLYTITQRDDGFYLTLSGPLGSSGPLGPSGSSGPLGPSGPSRQHMRNDGSLHW